YIYIYIYIYIFFFFNLYLYIFIYIYIYLFIFLTCRQTSGTKDGRDVHYTGQKHNHIYLAMKLQKQRGGRNFLQDIKTQDRDAWGSGVKALEYALQLERSVNQSQLDLHKLCSYHKESRMCDLIDTHLNEQLKSIKELADWVNDLRRMGAPQNSMAEDLFDIIPSS
uniref:Ferritin n=1 Tax=Amphiprion percula TaxID=161767 RepID=A0A3P8T4U2_AMPPE